MAYVVCKIHGGNVADFTSPGVIADIRNNVLREPNQIQRLFFVTEKKSSVLVDKDFINEHDLVDVSEIVLDINNENHINLLYEFLRPVCPVCLEEYLKKMCIKR